MSDGGVERLTERERDCLRRVARGRSSKEIGAELGISHHTVDLYIKRAIKTLGTTDRRGAARIFEASEGDARRHQRLDTQSPALAEPPPVRSILPPVRKETVSGIRVPFLRQGRRDNDLTKVQRLLWIPLLALLFLFVIANFFNGLGALYAITS